MRDFPGNLRGRKKAVRSHRVSLVIRNGKLLRITGIYRPEKTEHIEMKHSPERQSFTLDNPVIVPGEQVPVGIDVRQQHVAVQNQRICLVPCLVHPCPPVQGAVFIFRKVAVISPY